ncbi:MAG: YraN family protein [Bacteroidota bacterium]
MSEHNDLGKQGEDMACQHLCKNGYEVLGRNLFFRKAELDIVAKKGNDLVFVEVKTRTKGSLMSPEQAVDMRKQRLIIEAASDYIEKMDVDMDARFDIISVVVNGSESTIEHIESAFFPSI